MRNLEFAYFSLATDLMKKYIDITPNSKLEEIYKQAADLSSTGAHDQENGKKLIADFIKEARNRLITH